MTKKAPTPLQSKASAPRSLSSDAALALQQRNAGALLHISSLPSPYGIGDLGKNAFAFADWVAACGIKYWQVLPLVPAGDGNSPYSTWTSFACNPAFIDLEDLVAEGLTAPIDPATLPAFRLDAVDFPQAMAFKMPLLNDAAKKLVASPKHRLTPAFQKFCAENSDWLDDAVLFAALRAEHNGARWWHWEAPLRDRKPEALASARKRLSAAMDIDRALQFLFAQQWERLKNHCSQKGVILVGDIPIYVGGDSVDVWVNRPLFKLKADGTASHAAGVPPDAFSSTGQFWGNPVYNWSVHEKTDFAWWVSRIKRVLSLTDIIRIDHFRGLAAYWEIPAGSVDARPGKWVPAPGQAFINAIQKSIGSLPFIAEDLGLMDDSVAALRDSNGLPGMSVTEFAFGGSPHAAELPHNHKRNLAVYPGTHDNETLVGWWRNLSENSRTHVQKYLGIFEADERRAADAMIRMTLGSVANTVIVSLQDFLGLDNSARMNSPGTEGPRNWAWRLRSDALGAHLTDRVKELISLYGRSSHGR